MQGYYFVISEYCTGGYGISAKQFTDVIEAQSYADKQAAKPLVKRAFVAFQNGIGEEINLNEFV